jgi:dihydrofolate synthase/folylpolyglutamate synthase
MNYQESLDYLKSLAPTLERPTMGRIKLFFEELGQPQNKLSCFHVGGTNGKGSVTTFIASMLSACGKKVGKFTGPHLLKFNERINVDGEDIDDQSFAQVATAVFEQSNAFAERHPDLGPLTWFEFLTAMAVHYFNQQKVDFAVFEVGLGGRFDATNALDNIVVTTITNVDLDHMQLLGNTVTEIAGEKAGIIKTAPLVTAAGGDALVVLRQRAVEKGVPLIALDNPSGDFSPDLFKNFFLSIEDAGEDFERKVKLRVSLIQKLLLGQGELAVRGAYQRLNALTALVTLCASDFFGHQVEDQSGHFVEELRTGLAKAYWPGRYEVVEDEAQIWDGAHNPHGARALRMSLEDMFGRKKFVFVFAAFQNKDLKSVLTELVRPGDYVLAPQLQGERPFHKFAQIEDECRQLQVTCLPFDNFAEACTYSRELIAKGQGEVAKMAIVTGSFATIREAKAH